jgi:ubiquinone/menaquinone biosynthesis C-methylase UbiE
VDAASVSAPADAFGRAAREYELGRPGWPEELVDEAARELGLGPGSAVLDLAAGTGKLTRLLVPRFGRVVAVEPDAAMLEVLAEVAPEAEARLGSGERIPLGDAEVDAVFVAEAFHWFASPHVVAEIARVLRPGGGLVLLWNIPTQDIEPPWPEEADRLVDEAMARGGEPGGAKVLAGAWRKPLAGVFEELRAAHLERGELASREELIAWMLSVSSIAAQSDEARRELAERLRELLPDRPYRRFFRTDLYWTRGSA